MHKAGVEAEAKKLEETVRRYFHSVLKDEASGIVALKFKYPDLSLSVNIDSVYAVGDLFWEIAIREMNEYEGGGLAWSIWKKNGGRFRFNIRELRHYLIPGARYVPTSDFLETPGIQYAKCYPSDMPF